MRWKLIVIPFFLLSIFGCSDQKSNNQNFKHNKAIDSTETEGSKSIDINFPETTSINQNGMILGLTDDSSISEKQTIHNIDSDDTYTPDVYIKNNFPEKFTYRIFFFQNYQQTEVIINNKKLKYIDLNLEARADMKLNVQFPSIKEGLNDILVLAVRDPENYLDKLQYVDSSQVYISRRVALISGDTGKIPSVNHLPISSLNLDEQEIYTDPFVSINDKKNVMSTLMSKDEITKAMINMGSNEIDKEFAFITIMGTEQLPINKFSYIVVKNIGNFELPIDYKFNNSIPQNVIISVIESPFTLDENILLNEGVKFTNLITVSP